MPIDINAGSNIPLSATPAPPSVSLSDMLAKWQGIRNAKQQSQQSAAASAQSLQEGAQTQQANALDIQEKQRALDQQQAINKAYQDAYQVDPATGKGSLDTDAMTRALSLSGHGSAAPAIAKSIVDTQAAFTKLGKDKADLATAHADAGGRLGAAVAAAGGDPRVFAIQGQQALDSGALEPADAQQLRAALAHISQLDQQDPTGAASKAAATQFAQQLMGASPEQQKLAAEKTTADAHGVEAAAAKANSDREAAAQPDINRKTKLEGDELQHKLDILQATKPADVLALVDQVVDPTVKANVALNARTKAQVQYSLAKGDTAGAQDVIKQAAAEVSQLERETDPRVLAAKINVSVGEAAGRDAEAAGGTTDDDYRRAGETYTRTGVMPPLGNSKSARARVLHEAGEFQRQNGLSSSDVVTMQSAYKGDAASLKKFQGTRDQIASFEDTAGKNLDLFLDAASKIPDTGSPWMNAPLRKLDERAVGSANMAAVNAARQVANNEIAKVTSGGGMSGVLSDSARKEVMDFNPKEATFAQTIAVAKVLKQDMANRRQAMDATLGDIKARIGGGATPAAPKPTPSGNYKPGDTRVINGKTVTRDANGNWN